MSAYIKVLLTPAGYSSVHVSNPLTTFMINGGMVGLAKTYSRSRKPLIQNRSIILNPVHEQDNPQKPGG
jgi:hypothetical protein